MSTTEAIRAGIRDPPRGKPFTSAHFLKHGARGSVDRALSRLVREATSSVSHAASLSAPERAGLSALSFPMSWRWLKPSRAALARRFRSTARKPRRRLTAQYPGANRAGVPHQRLEPFDSGWQHHRQDDSHVEPPAAAVCRRDDRPCPVCPLVSGQRQRDSRDGRHDQVGPEPDGIREAEIGRYAGVDDNGTSRPQQPAEPVMAEDFLSLDAQEQGDILRTVADRSGRPAVILEKHIWVCWALAGRFLHPGPPPDGLQGRHVTRQGLRHHRPFFRGRGHHPRLPRLRRRFRPLDPAVSKTRIRRFSDRLKGHVQRYTREVMAPALSAAADRLATAGRHDVGGAALSDRALLKDVVGGTRRFSSMPATPIMTSVWTVGCASFPTTTNSRTCDPTMTPCAPLVSLAPRRRNSTC